MDGSADADRGSPPAPPREHAFDPGALHATITALARPRLAGSDGGAEVAAELRRRFEGKGYQTRELEVAFSALPGRYGLPAAGAVLAVVAIAGAWMLLTGRAALAAVTLAAGLATAALPLRFLDALLRLPRDRVTTANLLFTRDTPRWIVMAHRDSKSQGVPTAVRTVALATALLGWTGLAAAAVAAQAGGPVPGAWVWATGGALLGSAAVMARSVTGNRSPGALDNATGLAALLALADRVAPDVAFLVTDGEELGLAGARAATDTLPGVAGVINLDGLDDRGPVRIAESRGVRARGAGATAAALLEEARARGLEAVRRPLPPFVMVDHEPLARAGMPALTVLKGDWRSLLRVHGPGDRPDRLTGAGAAEVAALVLAVLGRLTDDGDDTLRSGERSGHSPAP